MVSAGLAIALTTIAAKSATSSIILGNAPNRDAWAEVGTEVVDALINAIPKPESQSDSMLRRLLRAVEGQPARDFDVRMAAGRRFLRDLPATWRTEMDRRDLIRDARGAFVGAFAVAQQMGDPQRIAYAEVAVAGCWFWVPSIEDVRATLDHARRVLENAVHLPSASSSVSADLDAVIALQEALVPHRSGNSVAPGRRDSSASAPFVSPFVSPATPTSGALGIQSGRRKGVVRQFDPWVRIGLITPDDQSGDVILDHLSGPGYRGLRQNQRVSFATGPGPRGPRAKDVRLLT